MILSAGLVQVHGGLLVAYCAGKYLIPGSGGRLCPGNHHAAQSRAKKKGVFHNVVAVCRPKDRVLSITAKELMEYTWFLAYAAGPDCQKQR